MRDVSGSEPLLGRRMACFNRQGLNHLTRPLARHLPGLESSFTAVGGAVAIHETPVNVFRRSDGYVVALTYGAGADWVRNVLTAGVCDLITTVAPCGSSFHISSMTSSCSPSRLSSGRYCD